MFNINDCTTIKMVNKNTKETIESSFKGEINTTEKPSVTELFGKYNVIDITDEILESFGIKTKNENGEYRSFKDVIAEIKEKNIKF